MLIVGRSDDWLAVRNVRGHGEVVFVDGASVTPDADTAGLPERDCESAGVLALGTDGSTTTLPDTTSTVPGTTTTVPGTTTTVADTTTTTVAATTTTAADTNPPGVAQQSAVPNHIWEADEPPLTCPPANPRQATISAIVTDDRGVASVTASWQFSGKPTTTVTMTHSGSLYSVAFGPFPYETVPPVQPYDNAITITIRARDAAGNQTIRTVVVTLTSAASCFT